jgi:hypothetical protein
LIIFRAGPLIFLTSFLLLVYFYVTQWFWSDPSLWGPDISKIQPGTEEFVSMQESVMRANAKWAHKYKFDVGLFKLHRLGQDSLSDEARLFFHGTNRQSASIISRNGFSLPVKRGKFGIGIYLTPCPLTTVKYCSPRPGTRCKLPCGCVCSHLGGVILVCDVVCDGRPLRAKRLYDVDKSAHKSKKNFHAALGMDKRNGGRLRAPELVVFNPSRVRVRYIIEPLIGAPRRMDQAWA